METMTDLTVDVELPKLEIDISLLDVSASIEVPKLSLTAQLE